MPRDDVHGDTGGDTEGDTGGGTFGASPYGLLRDCDRENRKLPEMPKSRKPMKSRNPEIKISGFLDFIDFLFLHF